MHISTGTFHYYLQLFSICDKKKKEEKKANNNRVKKKRRKNRSLNFPTVRNSHIVIVQMHLLRIQINCELWMHRTKSAAWLYAIDVQYATNTIFRVKKKEVKLCALCLFAIGNTRHTPQTHTFHMHVINHMHRALCTVHLSLIYLRFSAYINVQLKTHLEQSAHRLQCNRILLFNWRQR